jgi:hypothetical protein
MKHIHQLPFELADEAQTIMYGLLLRVANILSQASTSSYVVISDQYLGPLRRLELA